MNNLIQNGRRAFAEFAQVYQIETEFDKMIEAVAQGEALEISFEELTLRSCTLFQKG